MSDEATAAVKMYTTRYCPYCIKAKRFLDDRGVPYEEIDLEDNPAELARVKKEIGWRTVPIVLIGGKLVGGCSELLDLARSGLLEEKLASP